MSRIPARRASATTAATLLIVIGWSSPAAATGPADVTGGVSHEDEIYEIPANPECGNAVDVTETQQGVERLRIVQHGDAFHFIAGESVTTTTSSTDPSFVPVPDRKITSSVVFHAIRGGQVIVFSENYTDRDTAFGDIRVHATNVEVNGTTKVDRFTGKNLPPDGC